MSAIFEKHFGPQGPIPLREPLFHEVEYFYNETKKSNAHNAIGLLIEKISGVKSEVVDELPITTLREGQAYLLEFINHDPEMGKTPELLITLADMITSFNGQEAWNEVQLREPSFKNSKGYYQKLEASDAYTALVWLMSELSGVNQVALKKMPITRFREGQNYLMGFLHYFPKKEAGKTK